jgi:dihydrofolate synthase/folylpolyglutamate synthase
VSPHISNFRERIQVNREFISESAMLQHLPRVLQRCVDLSIPATLFEITFILACLHYEDCQCDAVVLEVLLNVT